MKTKLRYIAFQLVASSPDGKPIYSVADIIEPSPRYRSKLLRSARLTAGMYGYVLVGRVNLEWSDFEAGARRIAGIEALTYNNP